MRKQDRTVELLELLKVPEVAKVMFLALDEAKGKLKDEIDKYRNAKNLLKKLKENVPVDSYRFELKKTGDDEWRVLNISPDPPEGMDIKSKIIKDVLPRVHIDKESPGNGEIFNEFISKDEQNYNVQFIKFKENHFFGVMREIGSFIERESEKEIEIGNIKREDETGTLDEKYREIFYYMEKDAYIREFLFDCFFMLLRPNSNN